MSDSLKDVDVDNSEMMAGNFIHDIIDDDISEGGRHFGLRVHTRFPPEPNGYLHIGHAKAIYIDFGTAKKYGGLCNLRMDDTNPSKEKTTYVEAIKEDVKWLGYDWDDRFYYASDFFEDMYLFAEELIQKDLAFVCEQTAEEVRLSRGTLTQPGTPSPWRDRDPAESLDLFRRMRAGEFPDGSITLRAKIDMSSGNMNMRDPVIYRIMRATHHRTGDDWLIYPMYDFAHPIEDAMEHITHSLCTIEFEDHRPLYDWVIENCSVPSNPRQIEFAPLGINYTVMSKRKLRVMVEEGIVDGWDDPRLPTLCGMRRRGYTPEAIIKFNQRNGVSKVPSTVEFDFLEFCVREDLNERATRVMGVLDPIKLTIENYPEDMTETFIVDNHPQYPDQGSHEISFSRHLWIERDDFMEEPARKYFRLYPGNEVRLRAAYIVRCTGCKKDEDGNITEVLAEYIPESKGGVAPDGQKVKGTIHWVNRKDCLNAEVHLYDKLFNVEDPDSEGAEYKDLINSESLIVVPEAKLESAIQELESPSGFQFMRLGYFKEDSKLSTPDKPVFNRVVTLRDTYKP
ncbi:MAG TPA: glutamine--tRNA ligase/YqeY domain fusion protein [Clostridiaceae bacterium]|nr:glutamine--tRNA ligase/YqeY domain fusion protein [Clostridiaceae bacterium]